MMPISALSPAERDAALVELSQWVLDAGGKAMVRDFHFADFAEAFGFMARVAIHAEKADHHPEWSNVYNRVTIALTTHDCDGLSQRDVDLARVIDAIA